MADDDYYRNAIEVADKEAIFASIASMATIGIMLVALILITLL